jgi:hypothetical protein
VGGGGGGSWTLSIPDIAGLLWPYQTHLWKLRSISLMVVLFPPSYSDAAWILYILTCGQNTLLKNFG